MQNPIYKGVLDDYKQSKSEDNITGNLGGEPRALGTQPTHQQLNLSRYEHSDETNKLRHENSYLKGYAYQVSERRDVW